MNEAVKKIDGEIETYRKKAQTDEPGTIYNNASHHVFMEGTAWYARELANAHDDLAALIMVDGKALVKCAEHVMEKARSVCGGANGDLSTDTFHEAIWEYYRMPVEIAKTAIADANERRKVEQAERSKKDAADAKARAEKAKAEKAAEKRRETGQMSMFEMFQAGTRQEETVKNQEQCNSNYNNIDYFL